MKNVVSEIKELGEEPIKKLASMTTKERTNLFKKTLSDTSAEKLNKEFEKSIASQKLNGLADWVKNNLDEKYRADFNINNIKKKIKNLDDLNDYIDNNLESFVLQKNKAVLTATEVKKFNELGKNVLEAQKKMGDNFGDVVDNFDSNLNYAKSLKEIQEYSQSLVPSSALKTFVKSTGKAVMLASIKSPLLNVIANTAQGLMEGITRRFANKSIGGKVDSKLLIDYVKSINKIYQQTGIDFSRMIDVGDVVAGVGKTLGEEVSTPKNKYVRSFTDFIFNKTLSTPDVAFSSLHFADSANLVASRYAKGSKSRANEIFKDALRIEPRTTEGQMVRMQSIADAQYATFTNESKNAKLNAGIRKILGPAGDIMMPFVKTPANVIESGLDYAGLGALKGVYKMQKAIRADGIKGVSKEAWTEIAKDVTRAGLGMTGAFILAQTINESEFMGAYDPARTGIDQLKNTTYNAVKIGNKWVNVDYFGPIGVPLVSMLYAKKYGDKNGMMKSYAMGMVQQFAKSPGIEPLATTTKELLKIDPETGKGLEIGGIPQTIFDEFGSRLVPGLMYDLAKATDDVQRDTKQSKYAIKTSLVDLDFDKFIAKLPFVRKTLTEKHDSLGRVMLEEDPVTSLMFGARVRTSRDDAITDEIFRLRDAGQKPNVRDIRFMNSTKVNELKEKVGKEKFYELSQSFGESIANAYEKEISSASYNKLSDEEKKKKLDTVMEAEYSKLLKSNGIKYK